MARRNQDLALTPSMPGTFLPLAHPTLVARPPSGVGWIHEIKFDGYRFLALINAGEVTLLTRNGKDWTSKFPAIAEQLAALPVESAVLDGELVGFVSIGDLVKYKISEAQAEADGLKAYIAAG